MPKIEANSVDYNSLIGTDFKNVALNSKSAKHNFPIYFSIAVALIGILIVSVVLGHSNQSAPSSSTLPVAANISPSATPSDQFSIELKLKPAIEKSQSQTIALRVETDLHAQENSNDSELQSITTSNFDNQESEITVTVKKGDTLSSIF